MSWLITNLFIFWVVLTGTLRHPLIAIFDFFLVQIFFFAALCFFVFFNCGGQLCSREKKNIKITKMISFMFLFYFVK